MVPCPSGMSDKDKNSKKEEIRLHIMTQKILKSMSVGRTSEKQAYWEEGKVHRGGLVVKDRSREIKEARG